MSELIHLIYASAASEGFHEHHLDTILASARRNNAALNVTGMLLYTKGSFFQVLEGEEQDVLPLYHAISADDRHEQVVLIIKEPIARRSFGEWSMGLVTRSEDGGRDTLQGATAFEDLSDGRAKKLLSTFLKGRWRQIHPRPGAQYDGIQA